ncbi:MAG: Cof-type HAD-IIB family hydrolase [Armatimonadota bacterium]|nr:Cof-type HAD-IIB family hydrolase [Armatimonadota bacterium]
MIDKRDGFYRLIVADIDGTLVTSDRRIPVAVADAVRRAQSRGVRVCLATGRIWRSAQPYVRAMGADPPVILYNGGLVYDFVRDEVLRRVPLDPQHAALALGLLQRFPRVRPHLYVDDRVLVDRRDEVTQAYERKDGLRVEEVGDLLPFAAEQPMKILIIGPRDALVEVDRAIASLRVPVQAVFSEQTYLEILPFGSSKGTALATVADRLGVPLEETIAVGDNFNDLTMIEAAGLGVAMGNAPAELRERADFVTASNDEGGLREVIERFVLRPLSQTRTEGPRNPG